MRIRFVITSLLALLYACTGAAQTPQYTFPNMPQDPDSVYLYGSYLWRNDASGTFVNAKYQCIYRPFMFPGVPAGKMINLYVRAATRNYGADTACTYDSFKVSMGYTEDTCYDTHNRTIAVPFLTGLTTVFQMPSFRLAHPKQGDWIKIPLSQGSFSYNPTQNFVVEWRGGARGPNNGINIMGWGFGGATHRWLADTASVVLSKNSDGGVFAIGFDLAPVGVSEISNIRGVGLFPNPATNGRFNISLDAKQPMKEVSIIITDISGRELQSRKYQNPGSSFFEEINLKGAAKGMYFVRIAADGEVISRRVSIQ